MMERNLINHNLAARQLYALSHSGKPIPSYTRIGITMKRNSEDASPFSSGLNSAAVSGPLK